MNYWEGKLSKRYYYTCPIKSLYMMKEFRVKIEKFNLYDLFIDIETLSELGIAYGHGKEYKIYVAKESEHIFEPKNYDLAGFTRDDGISTVAQYDEAKKAFINGSFRILKKYNPKIIMRDNKQFFMPEVEND